MSLSPDSNTQGQDHYQARGLMRTIHNQLRDRGLTPLEAAVTTANALAGDVDPRINGALAGALEAAVPTLHDGGPLLTLLYQEFLVPEARSGLGQYLTPLPVADLVADIVAENGPSAPHVIDPFCGAGILLDRFALRRPDSILTGLEISEEIGAMTRALARLTLREIELRIVDSFCLWADGGLPLGDIVITNPPYGTTVSALESTVGLSVLPPGLRGMKRLPAELLGLEVAVDALVPGGLLGAVLPQSVLTNSSWSLYRSHLYSRLDPSGVVSLPEATFAPFRGVANACVLFGKRRRSSHGASTSRIPLFRSKSVGYDEVGRDSELRSDMKEAAACMRGATEDPSRLEFTADGSVSIESASYPLGVDSFRIGDIADVFCGRTPPLKEYQSDGPFLLKVGNLKDSFVSWSARKRSYLSPRFFDRHSKLHLKAGDICLTAAAHRPRYIGQKVNVIYDLPKWGAMPSAEILVIRLHDNAPMTPEELAFHLRSEAGYQQLQDIVRGSTAHLYPRDVAALVVPVAPTGCKTEAVDLFRAAADLHLQAVLAEQKALRAAGLM